MLQISSGFLRSVRLRSPHAQDKQTRPSGERLRQAVFNVLRHYRFPPDNPSSPILENAVVVDLFAGTGALGLEALSNGATEVWFVESHPAALRILEQNIQTVLHGFRAQQLAEPKIHILSQDISKAYAKLPKARVVFSDPPYNKEYFKKVIELEMASPCIESGGLLLFEADKSDTCDSNAMKKFDTKVYGDSVVHFFIKGK
jgi:16S rRNA (guanine966-N2)-methyltransferase